MSNSAPSLDVAEAWKEGAIAAREQIAVWLTTSEARDVLLESLGDGVHAGLASFADYIRTQVSL